MGNKFHVNTDRTAHPCWVWLSSLLAIGIPVVGLSQTAPPTPPPNLPLLGPTVARPILKLGSQGAVVEELQAVLQLLGFFEGAVTGTYDQRTAAAVSQFQQAAGLNADGVTGPATWERLLPPAPAIAPSLSSPSASVAPIPSAASPGGANLFPAPAGVNGSPSSTPAPTGSPSATPQPTPKPVASDPKPSAALDARPILRLGMQGPAVTELQQRLQTLGFLSSAPDGAFGPDTQAAVRAAQEKFGLEADGVVGPATWGVLLK